MHSILQKSLIIKSHFYTQSDIAQALATEEKIYNKLEKHRLLIRPMITIIIACSLHYQE